MLVFLVICCTLSYRFCKAFGPRLLILYFLFFAVIVLVKREVKVEFKLYESVFYNYVLFLVPPLLSESLIKSFSTLYGEICIMQTPYQADTLYSAVE